MRIINLLHIIRWPNLLMIIIIQGIICFRLVRFPDSVMSWADLMLLISITVLIAAAGFVINDIYDRAIDSINRPYHWMAGNQWTDSQLKHIYIVLLASGLLLSLVFSWKMDLLAYILVYPIAAGGLWFYSHTLKCRPIIGNVWVSLFCGGVVLIVAVPDWLHHNGNVVRPEIWIYVIFAFLTTWYREIIKDIEDADGDRKMGCQSFVVRYGIPAGKIMALCFCMLLLGFLIWWDIGLTNPVVKFVLIGLQGGVLASMAFVWWAKSQSYYARASTVMKWVMLAGTGILFFI